MVTGPREVAERSTSSLLTCVIADVRGYTRFSAERGDEAAAMLTSRFAEIAKSVVENFDGDVIELRGDEAFCVFPSARNAIRASVALQLAFQEATQKIPSLPLRVGIGLDAGEVVHVHDGYRGGAINRASRLCSIASAGEVLCSERMILPERGLASKRHLPSPEN